MKYSKQSPLLLEAKFKYAGVLVGLALLDDERRRDKCKAEKESANDFGDHEPVEDQIRRVTESLAPVLIPMIDNLSGLTESELEEFSSVGDDS